MKQNTLSNILKGIAFLNLCLSSFIIFLKGGFNSESIVEFLPFLGATLSVFFLSEVLFLLQEISNKLTKD